MIRRLAGLSPAIPFILAPVAFADDKKKSIYDSSNEPNLPGTTDSPKSVETAVTSLEAQINEKLHTETINANGFLLKYNDTIKSFVSTSRVHLESLYDQASAAATQAQNALFNGERSVTNTLSGLHSQDEELLPASVYILVAALSGSIVARRRNIVLRFLSPIAFGTAAFAYFLPKTYGNATSYAYKLEQERVPALAQAQDQAAAQLSQASTGAKKAVEQSESALKRAVSASRASIEQWTGLDFSGKANK